MIGPVATLTARSPNLRQVRWIGQEDYLIRDNPEQAWDWHRDTPIVLATANANTLLADLKAGEETEVEPPNQDKENQGLTRCVTQRDDMRPEDHVLGARRRDKGKGKGRASLDADVRAMDRVGAVEDEGGASGSSGKKAGKGKKGPRRSLFGEIAGSGLGVPGGLDFGPVQRRVSGEARAEAEAASSTSQEEGGSQSQTEPETAPELVLKREDDSGYSD